MRYTMGAYREGQRTTLPWEKEDIREDDVNMTLKSAARRSAFSRSFQALHCIKVSCAVGATWSNLPIYRST